jgi:hypothetical protein
MRVGSNGACRSAWLALRARRLIDVKANGGGAIHHALAARDPESMT